MQKWEIDDGQSRKETAERTVCCGRDDPAVLPEKPSERRQTGRGRFVLTVRRLLDYAKHRSEKCPFMEEKTFCANCKVHCYKPEVREQIQAGYAVFRTKDADYIIRCLQYGI